MTDSCFNCRYGREHIHGVYCLIEECVIDPHSVCLSHKYKENDKIELEEEDDLVK